MLGPRFQAHPARSPRLPSLGPLLTGAWWHPMQVQGQDDAVVGVCMGVIAGIDQHCGAPGISGAGQPVGTGQGAHRVVAVQHHPALRHFSPELLAICRAGGLGGHQAEVASPVSHHLLPFTGFLAKMPWPHHTTEVLCLNELGEVGR